MRDNGRGDKSLCPSSGYLQRENKARISRIAGLPAVGQPALCQMRPLHVERADDQAS